MKKTTLLLALFMIVVAIQNRALAQPANNNCSSALSNSLAPNASCTIGTMFGSTKEALETFGGVGCVAAATNQSVWYSFIASQANMWVDVKQINAFCTLGNLGITVWRWSGTCPPAGAIIGCKGFQAYPLGIYGNAVYNILNMTTLIPGQTYLVQISQRNTCAGIGADDFCVKVGTPSACTTCANPCGTMCIQQNWPTCCSAAQINYITANCTGWGLSPPLNQLDSATNCYSFTAANDTMHIQQIVEAYCGPGNTYSFTYNLYNNFCTQIGPSNVNVFANNMITGLTVGVTYRICYTLQAACTWDSIWPFGYTTGQSALPVELVSFGGIPEKNKIKLYWSTASEENSKEFVVEKLIDKDEYREVARVEGAGNSTILHMYDAYDENPTFGRNYYRLKQIDFNGEFHYSTIIVLVRYLVELKFSISPNPTSESVTIRFNSEGNSGIILKVYNSEGRVVLEKEFIPEEGANEFKINTADFQNGIYLIQLIGDGAARTSRFVIKN